MEDLQKLQLNNINLIMNSNLFWDTCPEDYQTRCDEAREEQEDYFNN